MHDPRVVTEPLGASALARMVAAGAAGTMGHLADPVPAAAQAWRTRAQSVAAASPGGWLDRLRGAFGGEAARIPRLERAAAANGIVVTTGQQAGLFGGPMYTWSKAIAALALADALEQATGIPTAPVFWAATDDADFAEASYTALLISGQVERLALSTAPSPGTPMALAPLVGTAPLLARLHAACGSLAHAPAWEAVVASYADGATVGGAYVALMRALLQPLGIAVLDSSHAEVRTAGADVVRRALQRGAAVELSLRDRRAWLSAHGFEPQVADVPGLTTVFSTEDGIKQRVRVAEGARVAASRPDEALSPNVLLRPVMERAILPTVCYVAGPGELAYFAQTSAVADALELARPLAVPRWSCTIVEPSVDRALERLGMRMEDAADTTGIEGRLARAEVPAAVRVELDALRTAVRERLEALRVADGGALLPPAVVQGAGAQLEFRIARLERRLVAAAKRRGSETLRDLALVRSALWPLGTRQERTLNFIPILARYGPAVWDRMRELARVHAEQLVHGGWNGG